MGAEIPGKGGRNALISALPSLQVSSESSSGTFVYQGFVRGKGFGQFGLQRLGKVPPITTFSLDCQKLDFGGSGGFQTGVVFPVPGFNFQPCWTRSL